MLHLHLSLTVDHDDLDAALEQLTQAAESLALSEEAMARFQDVIDRGYFSASEALPVGGRSHANLAMYPRWENTKAGQSAREEMDQKEATPCTP